MVLGAVNSALMTIFLTYPGPLKFGMRKVNFFSALEAFI